MRQLCLLLVACASTHKPPVATQAACTDFAVAATARPEVAHRSGRQADAAHCYREAIADFQIAIAADPQRDYVLDLCRAYVDAWQDEDAIACQQRLLTAPRN